MSKLLSLSASQLKLPRRSPGSAEHHLNQIPGNTGKTGREGDGRYCETDIGTRKVRPSHDPHELSGKQQQQDVRGSLWGSSSAFCALSASRLRILFKSDMLLPRKD